MTDEEIEELSAHCRKMFMALAKETSGRSPNENNSHMVTFTRQHQEVDPKWLWLAQLAHYRGRGATLSAALIALREYIDKAIEDEMDSIGRKIEQTTRWENERVARLIEARLVTTPNMEK